MKAPDAFHRPSPARQVLDRIADRWTAMVVCALGKGPRRYGELRRDLDGISKKMLTQTLRAMQRDGLVERTVIPATPPGVEYALTPLGRTLIAPLTAIIDWADSHHGAVVAAHAHHDRLAAVDESAGRARHLSVSGR
jgi:DNA-binding HxlR family transcriptional regulator